MPAGFNFTSDTEAMRDFVDGPKGMQKTTDQDTQPQPEVLRTLDPLVYDFDIVEVAPDPAQKAHLDALAALGQESEEANFEARWRDPRTVQAFNTASLGVRELFQNAGFGTSVSGRGLPTAKYDVADGPKRHDIIMRLTNYLADADASHFDWGQIDSGTFFKSQGEAVAVGNVQTQIQSPPDRKRLFALIGLAVGVGLLITAGFAAL